MRDPRTGASAAVAAVDPLPIVDGIEYDHGTVWAVQNRANQISRIDLDHDLRSGEVEEVIRDEDFQVPTTAIGYRGRLERVNAQFGLADAGPYEVVLVDD